MRILQPVLNALLKELHIVPPEQGGILGMRNGIICTFYLDNTDVQTNRYAYVPDIPRLNAVIAQWAGEGIRFAGMFHSHPDSQPRLSAADRAYIQKIMEVMPASISELHFPLILPGTGMIGHLAKRLDGSAVIVPENIHTVKE